MKLGEIYKSEKTVISFEIFPPDTDEKTEKLCAEIGILKNYNPEFVSLTYGAAGKNNPNTKKILTTLKTGFNFEVMPHFTCMCSSKDNIDANLQFFKSIGVENIFALRGDVPEDKSLICRDFCYANELVKYLRDNTGFSIAVAGYPEGHMESISLNNDIENLKKKVDAGADLIVTQMFFENERFYDYLARIEKAGINIPVAAGIMPVTNAKQLDKMTKLARVTVPEKLKEKIEKHFDDKHYIKETGIEYAVKQCRDLIKHNVKGLHIFTLNKAGAASKILDNIL